MKKKEKEETVLHEIGKHIEHFAKQIFFKEIKFF